MKKIFAALILIAPIAYAAVMTGTPAPVVREYQALGVTKILIENTAGKISVSPILVDRIEIFATKRKFSEKCSFDTQKSDYAEVSIKVERAIGEDCVVDLEVRMPKDANLNVWSSSGDVVVSGLESEFTFNVASGSVTANGKFKKVEGKSGSGSVEINGLTTGGSISVGSGSLNLRFLEYPKGKMKLKPGVATPISLSPRAAKSTLRWTPAAVVYRMKSARRSLRTSGSM